MDNQNLRTIKKIIPPDLFERGISLERIGVHEIAWNWQDALRVLSILLENAIPILGGDVYLILGDEIRAALDNWHINRREFGRSDLYLKESHRISNSYITSYASQKGDNYYYSIIVDRFPIGKGMASL
jgi:hypothetical protein